MMSMPCSFVKGTKKSSATCEFGTRSVYRCMYIYSPFNGEPRSYREFCNL